MNLFLTPEDVNGELITIEQYFKSYVNFFILENYGEQVARNASIFFSTHNLDFLLPPKNESKYIYMQLNEFSFINIPKKEGVILKSILKSFNFLRAILMIDDSIRIFKVPSSLGSNFKTAIKYELEDGDKTYFINHDISNFFVGKGFFNDDSIFFSYDVLESLEYNFLFKNKKYTHKQPIIIIFEKFLLWIKQRYKEEYIHLKKKQVESELEFFCSKNHGFFFLTKEQKSAIIQIVMPHLFGQSFDDNIDNIYTVID